MYLLRGNEAREKTRTVASESLLSKASVNENTQEKERDGQRQKDKDITGALACNLCRWIVPTFQANNHVRRVRPDPSIASYLPGYACHGLASDIPSWDWRIWCS